MKSDKASSALVRLFSSALASQAVLSVGSFSVGLLLIRRSSDLQYGYFILVSGAIILAVSLQGSFIGPAMVNRMSRMGPQACGDLTGGLYREQRRVIACCAGVALLTCSALWLLQLLQMNDFMLILAAIAATAMAMQREYFRMVLLAYHYSTKVLKGDLIYAVLMACGVLIATLSPLPAVAAVVAMGLAALASSLWLSRSLRQLEAWNIEGSPGILREIAPLAVWSTAGASVHWSFSQGYTYLAAATLDIGGIAAIAATRLLTMPVNLLSSGIGSLLLPLSSRWLHQSGPLVVLKRLVWLAMGVTAVAICYFLALWWMRDWLFDVVLKKHFEQQDTLLILWSISFVLMAIQLQLHYLLVVRQRFHKLTALTAISAVMALGTSYWGMRHFGGIGAPLGIVVGEFVNTLGIVVLCLREVTAKPVAENNPQQKC